MVRLWQRLGEALGAAFLNQYGAVGESAFETWSASMTDLTPAQIKTGFVNFMRGEDRYLDLKKFRALCLGIEKHGLPATRQAYEEACMKPAPKAEQSWSHPAVYHAGKNTGWHELASTPTDQIFARFEYNYAELCRRVMAGESLEIPVTQAIPSKIPNFCSKEQNKYRMAALREETGI